MFTDTPLRGNALAVVHDADALDDDQMLAFARETRLSETTFVQSATVPGADYRNRIFTVVEEVRFAGHPSLGTAVAVARERGEREASYVQQTEAGLQPVTAVVDGDRAHASVLQEAATFGPELDPTLVMAAVGLEGGAADTELPPQAVSTGLGTLIAPVATDQAVARAQPHFEAIDALLAPLAPEVPNLYVAHCKPDGHAHARMFSRLVREGEDAATGSAAGPLCAYLRARRGLDRLEVRQGVEMGRPSLLLAETEGDRVRVAGDAVVIVDGVVRLP